MVWSDKSVSAAMDTYNSAVNDGIADWYAMRLALDVAFEENGGVINLSKEKEYSAIYLSVITGLAISLGIVILLILLYFVKG